MQRARQAQGDGQPRTSRWIGVLLALLLALNGLGLLAYLEAHPKQDFWRALWTYLESDTAKMIVGSLVIPLILLLVERRFNLIEAVRATRIERRRKSQDERREARLKSIEDTARIWSQLTDLGGEIVFWDGQASLDEQLKKCWSFTVAAEDALNSWQRFPNLDSTETDPERDLATPFITLANALLHCIHSTAYHLRLTTDDEERKDLQRSLWLICDAINVMTHHSLLRVLNDSLELLEISESQSVAELRLIDSSEQARARRAHHEEMVRQGIGTLKTCADLVKSLRAKAGPLSTATSEEANAFRSHLRGSDYEQLRNRYLAIPRSERLVASQAEYTKEWMASFADELSCRVLYARLQIAGELDPQVQLTG